MVGSAQNNNLESPKSEAPGEEAQSSFNDTTVSEEGTSVGAGANRLSKLDKRRLKREQEEAKKLAEKEKRAKEREERRLEREQKEKEKKEKERAKREEKEKKKSEKKGKGRKSLETSAGTETRDTTLSEQGSPRPGEKSVTSDEHDVTVESVSSAHDKASFIFHIKFSSPYLIDN